MPYGLPATHPAKLLAVEIAHSADRLASVLRRCPPPSRVDHENVRAVERILDEARDAIDVMASSHADLVALTDVGDDERDLCESTESLLEAQRRMVSHMASAVDQLAPAA